MWYAGVGWCADTYVTAVLDRHGAVVQPPTAFPADQLDRLVGQLGWFGPVDERMSCVIDTTSGVVERRLVEAGMCVYRADPWLLADRPAGGSAGPLRLAELGWRGALARSRLTLADGALTGRELEVQRALRDSAAVESRMRAAGQLIQCGSGGHREVALTFDDGPDPVFTERILAVLRSYQATASFFCVGLSVHAHPRLVERIVEAGHEVGNHTWSHAYLPDLSTTELEEQLGRTSQALARITGQAPGLFRPPYGGRSPEVLRRLAGSGMTTVLWDVEAPDWALPGAAMIEKSIVDVARDGSIILLHDGGGNRSQTVSALPLILARLSDRGYRFVPVSRLLRRGPAAGH